MKMPKITLEQGLSVGALVLGLVVTAMNGKKEELAKANERNALKTELKEELLSELIHKED